MPQLHLNLTSVANLSALTNCHKDEPVTHGSLERQSRAHFVVEPLGPENILDGELGK